MTPNASYTGSCYVGVVGGEAEIGEARDSIERIALRPGDDAPRFVRATKGFEARQIHFNQWLTQTRHPFMLLLDHDMIFAPDTLERLRSHRRPYVSGFYMRRMFQPIAPVWFELGARGKFPLKPWLTNPERGKLHPLGASGWGCILIHRDVAEAVAAQLKGEPFVIEDDLDVWPYDLAAVMSAIRGLRTLITEQPSPSTLYPALAAHVAVLEREIKPLRVVKDNVGSDIRFPFFAREAGYVLMGDPDVRPGHVLNYPLSPDDFMGMGADSLAALKREYVKHWRVEKNRIEQAREAVKS